MHYFWYFLLVSVYCKCVSKRLDFIRNPETVSTLRVNDISTWKYDAKYEQYDLIIQKDTTNITEDGLVVNAGYQLIPFYIPWNLSEVTIQTTISIPLTSKLKYLSLFLLDLDTIGSTPHMILQGISLETDQNPFLQPPTSSSYYMFSEYYIQYDRFFTLNPQSFDNFFPSLPILNTFITDLTKNSVQMRYNNILVGEMKSGIDYMNPFNTSDTVRFRNTGFLYGIRGRNNETEMTRFIIESIDVKCLENTGITNRNTLILSILVIYSLI